jgi:SAM-dependent methyltransferase
MKDEGKGKRKTPEEYNRFYSGGGWKYDREKERAFLLKNIPDLPSGGTLLDVGCGDGFWSNILSEWYDVLGIDTATAAIEIARKNCPKCKFVAGDALCAPSLLREGYDVVFMRAPSFLNFSTADPDWERIFTHVALLAKRRVYYIQWTDTNKMGQHVGNTYCHNPICIEAALSKMGKAFTHVDSNYIFARLQK